VVTALGGLTYAAVMLRTLSFAYRSAAPGRPVIPAFDAAHGGGQESNGSFRKV
jgi:hypothetical protein